MKAKYKKLVVECLYGLIEGSSKGLEEMLIDYFICEFKFPPEKLIVIGSDKFIKNLDGRDIWIGTMTVTLIIEGEEYKVSRNWEEEYYIDRKHPNYKTDKIFYDSHKKYSSNKYREIMNDIG